MNVRDAVVCAAAGPARLSFCNAESNSISIHLLSACVASAAGAAAAGGGALSPALLRAMQDSWADSSSANTADQLADQEAQLRYLQASNVLVVAERDQLLTINRRMVSLLVEQIKALQLSSSSAATTSSSTDQEAGSGLDVLGQSCAAASCGGSTGVKAGQSAARLRRCLSFEVRMASCVSSCHSQSYCMRCLHGGAGCVFPACVAANVLA
jgi:hypothetical protein